MPEMLCRAMVRHLLHGTWMGHDFAKGLVGEKSGLTRQDRMQGSGNARHGERVRENIGSQCNMEGKRLGMQNMG